MLLNSDCVQWTQDTAEAQPLSIQDSYEEMTLEEIFHGKDGYYPGLIPLVYAYLEYIQCDDETFRRVDQYLQYISGKVRGETMTTAAWIREFVTSHPAYQQDSFVTEEIAHDLLLKCKEIGEGTQACREILGDIKVERIRAQDAYGTLMRGRLSNEERGELINNLIRRALIRCRHHEERGAVPMEELVPSERASSVDRGMLSRTVSLDGAVVLEDATTSGTILEMLNSIDSPDSSPSEDKPRPCNAYSRFFH